ncbi:Cyclohexadienyl dehydratase precursor [Stieleria neptunia]|uniref:Cyclohexadienyl dehydratase n=1 Tax=Stieleria neptunia TaxID=2527979 RepID=A0A518HUA2_9BACT|nr:cation:dicarboxylase symporter family transporter [Stieleria neptunia]QDV44394.1 Cyclohexadienyl dehydratase precursor [Stieleria neptunia]
MPEQSNPTDATPPSVQGWYSRFVRRVDLSTQILIALALGIFGGLFAGEWCAPLAIIGEAFVGLLRMTVLPYILVTLVVSLGRLRMRSSRRLALIGGTVLLGLWTSCLVVVWVLPTSFPQWSTGSFFSTALIEGSEPIDVLSYFVPANIFESLSNNQVPAVVLFGICCGLALSKSRNRTIVLNQLDVAADVLLRISKFITRLAPVGIFAIAASTAGTVSLAEVGRLQAYLVAYTAGAVFLGFAVLPLLVTTLTPLTYRQVLFVVKEPMLTAFATGKLIIVLPMLIENTERLFETQVKIDGKDESPAIDVLYGTAYPFPHVGKLLSMLFIPFAAWFLGAPIKPSDYPDFLFSGLFSFFGGPIVAIPFLLDQMQLPHDMFQLFLVSGVYGERLGDAVGAMHLCVLTLISIFGFNRMLCFQLWGLVKYATVVCVFGVIILVGVRLVLYRAISMADNKYDVIERMQLLEQPVESIVIKQPVPNPAPLRDGESLLQRIRRRGALRVGYNEDNLPFAYFNNRRALVGYDIEMAHSLARDLGVTLELVRFDRATLVDQLNADHFDIVMSGLVGTLERAQAMAHTDSYMDVNLALVTRDFRSGNFRTLKRILALDDLQIGFADLSRGFVNRIEAALPDATLVEIPDNRDYFNGQHPDLDALLISAESGSAFTLMYPRFEVVIPNELNASLPLFYAVGNRDAQLRDFLEYWVGLRKKDGTAQDYYNHWVLGKTNGKNEPRWSILRDYLGWIR